MTSAGTTPKKTATPACAEPTAAVLYVCAERGLTPGLAAQRAEGEGRRFAEDRGLTLVDVIEDEYGEPDPCLREGWMRVRELANSGAAAVVIVRWPASIAPESAHELRHREIQWLQERGVHVRYSCIRSPRAATRSSDRLPESMRCSGC